jgi:REP element-mobilizing transposase RayT
MSRQLRPYFPGGFFHVTARTRGRAAWFDETLRDHICEVTAIVQRQCDVRIAAFVVMTNHLHFVVQQGDHPLVRFMHPLLCRIAASVKKKYSVEGHVFERRYWSYPCGAVDYLRTCIHYVHRNPVKALLCTDARDYKWSSYGSYHDCPVDHPVIVEPIAEFYLQGATHCASLPAKCNCACRPLRDLGDVVDYVLRRFDPPVDIKILRNIRGFAAAKIRSECIEAGILAGYRNCQIAKYLNISEGVVSKIAVQVRQNAVVTTAFLNESKSEAETQVRKK